MPRRRLDQVDSMRPVKQAVVISTHVLMYFVPAGAGASAGALLDLTHVSREGFFFVSACMLTYAYLDMKRSDLGHFYWRRLISVGIPFLCWTLIYFLYLLPTAHYASPAAAFGMLLHMLEFGYFQLYFLIVIMQFYLVFPLVLMMLRRTRGHHGIVVTAAAAAQLAEVTLLHWGILPHTWSGQDPASYVLYLIGGGVVACHLREVHEWLCRNARLVIGLTVLAALAAVGVYYLAATGVTTALGSGADAFQPSVVPFNVGAIACAYLAGVALTKPGRSPRLRAMVRSGVDSAYGIYLTQMIFISALIWLDWGSLDSVVWWPAFDVLTVVIIYLGGVALTSVIARTPLAVALTGRRRQSWRSLLPRREGDGQRWPAASSVQVREQQPPQLTDRTERSGDTRLDPVG
jgi:peptidoglycan/LPS O-acetylase OafA/YrhL